MRYEGRVTSLAWIPWAPVAGGSRLALPCSAERGYWRVI